MIKLVFAASKIAFVRRIGVGKDCFREIFGGKQGGESGVGYSKTGEFFALLGYTLSYILESWAALDFCQEINHINKHETRFFS